MHRIFYTKCTKIKRNQNYTENQKEYDNINQRNSTRGITFTRYTHNQLIGKLDNLNVFEGKKTKEPKQDGLLEEYHSSNNNYIIWQ
jgi:hypothetical protein